MENVERTKLNNRTYDILHFEWCIYIYSNSIRDEVIKTLPLLLSGNNRQIDKLCFYNV